MAELERIYNVPLRNEYRKAPNYKRAFKSVKALREFLQKHMKCDVVKIGKYANLEIHKNGRSNVPHHIKVFAKKEKDEKGNFYVLAELYGAPVEQEKVKPQIETKKNIKAIDVKPEEIKKDKFEEEKKKILEHPDSKKPQKGKEEKTRNEKEEDMERRKDIVHRSDKKGPIKN